MFQRDNNLVHTFQELLCTIPYLVTEGMTTNSDGVGPAGYEARNALADDWFPKDGTSQDVTYRAIG